MLTKSYSKTGKSCRVTFKTQPEDVVAEVALLGEFNDWNPETHPMKKRKDGTYSATVSLDAGREYRFRYLVDGEVWGNEDGADSQVPNRFGSRDSLLSV